MSRSYIECNNSSTGQLPPIVTTPDGAVGKIPRMPRRVGEGNGPINHHLQEWREARGFTQEALAEKAGTTKATISRTESGKQGLTQAALKLYAELLGTHPSILLSRAPTPEEAPPRQRPRFDRRRRRIR